MQSPVLTVDAPVTLEAAHRLMLQRDPQHLPVRREGRLVGTIADRKIRPATAQPVVGRALEAIGALPILQEAELAGIDLLNALLKPSGRREERPGERARLSGALAQQNARTHPSGPQAVTAWPPGIPSKGL